MLTYLRSHVLNGKDCEMRLREAPVFIVMALIMMFVSVTPVSARSAPAITGSIAISGGTATYRVQRDGWRVVYEVTVKDTANDSRCAYAKLVLDITDGFDQNARTPNVCGRNKSTKFTGRIVAGSGTGLRSIKVSICIDRNLSTDPCRVTTKSIPQHNKGSLTSAQLAQLNSIFNSSLSSFLRTRSQRPSPFDWNQNGCSTVYKGVNLGGTYTTKFRDACIRHDFGYRNYGGNRYYLHTDSMRQTIDLKFYNDMLAICGSSSTCRVAAKGFYEGVRKFGGKFFAGQN